MNPVQTRSPFVITFLLQVDAIDSWLDNALSAARIVGTRARRARARVIELKDEIAEICDLIASPPDKLDLSRFTEYADFDAGLVFAPELAKRADAGIQDLGSAIQDELVRVARAHKKELGAKLLKGNPGDQDSMTIWEQMSACDCIEEVGSTVYRLAEASRILFQTEFLRVLRQVATPATPAPEVPAPRHTGDK
ncbi:MAG: hypothetical protein SGJ27_09045 [Candidatus Melainabacteria bacterium]|nr:hypothetical protein [Candidatus Melainabacteria bacterium]